MVGDDAAQLPEPERAHLGEHGPFPGNGVGKHDVERADAIGGDQQQRVLVDGVDLAHFAAANQRERQRRLGNGGVGQTVTPALSVIS